jgi:membrane protease YdiL (CAAX protease family)
MIRAASREVPLPRTGTMVVVLGTIALAARPVGWMGPAVALVVWAAAVAVPIEGDRHRGQRVAAVTVGMVALGLTRLLLPPGAAPPVGTLGVAASVAVAVAEEALFRRLLYHRLIRFSALTAILGSAVAFALVHVPWYPPAAIPVNLGAGILFGWQRWATGGWGPAAATHAAANVMAVIG